MSGVDLAVPYLDTRAEHLSFALDRPKQRALAVTVTQVAGVRVELRLLGASHQVFAGPVAETLACLPGEGGGPPPCVSREFGGWRYRFTSRVHHCAAGELTRRTTALRRSLTDRPGALWGVFPGSPDALTALLAWEPAAGGISWQTWHAYPQADQLVTTRTRLEAS